MKKIPLTKGYFALVDDADFENLSRFNWYYSNGYAMRNKPDKTGLIRMHRIINNTPDGLFTDHINRNKLDNRRCNLRTVTKSQNEHNTGARKNNKLGVKGVMFESRRKIYRAEIMVNRKKYWLGYFKLLKDAVLARKQAEKIYGTS